MRLVEPLECRTLLSTTYYVDPSATAGARSGLTPTDAWTSLTAVNTFAPGFKPGDSILFRAGQTAAAGEGLVFGADDGTASPSAAAIVPVVLNTYDGFAFDPMTGSYAPTGVGAGAFTIQAGNARSGISVTNTAGFDISHLTLIGAGQANGSYSGISFDNGLAGNTKLNFVHIENVDVSGFGKYGITVGGSNAKSGFNDVRVTDVNVHDNTLGGIETHGVFSSTSTNYANTNVYVSHAQVHHNPGYAGSPNHSGDGIVIADADGIVIERCVAWENGAKNTHSGGPVGIWVWDVNNAVIQNNESHHNHTAGTADGGGFDFDGGVTNSVMQYNYSHDNDGEGYGIYQFSGARPFRNNTVRYNISANDARKNTYGAIDFWNGNGTNGISNVSVYNNTVYSTPSVATVTTTNKRGVTTTSMQTVGNPRALRFTSGTSNVSVRNNIFQTTGGVQLAEIQATQTNLLIQGNNWWSSGAAFSIKAGTATFSSFSAFVNGTSYEKLGGSIVGKNVDPLFMYAGNVPTVGNTDLLESSLDRFKLTSTSSLRNAGLNLSSLFGVNTGTRDFFGDVLPGDGSTDIGAHEYA